jgi:hypothetical protein
VIAPDNFDKKFNELRGYTFGDIKAKDEKGFDEDQQPLTEIDQSSLDLIVERIFAKAQTDHDYVTMNGELVEKMIKLELRLRGFDPKMSFLKHSQFRKTLLAHCKDSFERIF